MNVLGPSEFGITVIAQGSFDKGKEGEEAGGQGLLVCMAA